MSDMNKSLMDMTDAELEQMIISIIQTENSTLSKRFYGNLKKEFTAMKEELLKELSIQTELIHSISGGRRPEDNMAKFPEVYKSPQWEVSRQYVINRDMGLCVFCKEKGKITPGNQVDHIVELTEENMNDWNIAYNPDNLRLLCDCCHQHRHGRSIGLQDFMNPPGV